MNASRKRVLQNHAKKMAKLKVRFRIIRKRKNRLMQGKNKEQRKEYSLGQRFKDYKHIKAPSLFSLTENTEETLSFVSKLEECLEQRRKVFVNLSEVEIIAHGAIVVLLSIMVKFKSERIDFNGNFPKNKSANKALADSGFITELYKKKIELGSSYDVRRNKILTHANKVVDSKLTDRIISDISTQIWGQKRRCPGLQRVYIELMQNTNNHASLVQKGEHLWWTTVQYDSKKKTAYFSFIDYGVGILKSLTTDTRGKFYNIIPQVRSLFKPNNNAELLMLLLKGEVHKTSTGKYYRGKGLPCLFKACEDGRIANVVVIANDAKVEYGNTKPIKLGKSFSGTFVHWELNFNNNNIEYSI